jgi:hypothetical protein
MTHAFTKGLYKNPGRTNKIKKNTSNLKILILSFHLLPGLLSGLFRFRYQKRVCMSLVSHETCWFVFLSFSIIIIFGDVYKFCGCSLRNFLRSLVTVSFKFIARHVLYNLVFSGVSLFFLSLCSNNFGRGIFFLSSVCIPALGETFTFRLRYQRRVLREAARNISLWRETKFPFHIKSGMFGNDSFSVRTICHNQQQQCEQYSVPQLIKLTGRRSQM